MVGGIIDSFLRLHAVVRNREHKVLSVITSDGGDGSGGKAEANAKTRVCL